MTPLQAIELRVAELNAMQNRMSFPPIDFRTPEEIVAHLAMLANAMDENGATVDQAVAAGAQCVALLSALQLIGHAIDDEVVS